MRFRIFLSKLAKFIVATIAIALIIFGSYIGIKGLIDYSGKPEKAGQEPSYTLTEIRTSKGRVHTFIIFKVNGQTVIIQDPDSEPRHDTSGILEQPEKNGETNSSKL